ncbi:hypothetical protein [Phytohabitans houttuyneae]|uniref:Uncharacterized protein n=1 Tax=Phytohabitans houttuyneae TaxID=1076126 RepID=A0A6V8KCP3_9ACTN|nr:hypothetical protein [Phytohabitans houttuyneae]GFJ79756.1 hypothetical protein Phou_039360 [Phytohabitans houttuyneae]
MAGEIAAAVRELASAEVVAFNGVGLAARILPVTEAYRTIVAELPEGAEDLRPHLAWLLANGSPAGKAYAATLLATFDPEAARAAWGSLSHETAEFTTFHGCIMDRTTLGKYATGQLTVA